MSEGSLKFFFAYFLTFYTPRFTIFRSTIIVATCRRLNAEGIVDMESRFGFIESVEVHAFDLVDDEIHDLFRVLFALHLNMGTSNSKNKFLPSSGPSGFCLMYCTTNP
jgi:hypothetical protein